MRYVYAFLLVVLLVMPGVLAYNQTNSKYLIPNLQGDYISLMPKDKTIYLTLFVPPKNLNELYFIAQKVANHQILPLKPSDIINMFAQEDKVSSVADFLSSNGFKIVYRSPFSVMVMGTVEQVNDLFQTQLAYYGFNGITYYKPSTIPSIPAELDNVLIGGLTNITSFQPQYLVLGKKEGNVLFEYNGTHSTNLDPRFAFSFTQYSPSDIIGAYNVTPNGKGITIAIIDAFGDPLIYQDIRAFDSLFNLPPVNLTITPVGPYEPYLGAIFGWDIEVALDVEYAHAMAPYANINLVISSDNGPALYEAVDLVVTKDLAQVASMSWGMPENLIGSSGFYGFFFGAPFPNYPFLDYYFALGAAEGISFFASSGDWGAPNFGEATTYGGATFPSSSPFVTSVGGTTLYVNVTSGSISELTSNATYGNETAWSITPQYFGLTISTGGGVSTLFPTPWYQEGVLPYNGRATPDVAAVANPYTGAVIVGESQLFVIGGTSLSSPLWAGFTADMDSFLGKSLGLLNPILYWIYQNPDLYHKAFHDITWGYNVGYYAGLGYDLLTGIGSPNVGMLTQIIKNYYKPGLSISVTTFSASSSIPWYNYTDTFEIAAYITYPNQTVVTTGSFVAKIYTTKGYLDTVPLVFSNGNWIGTYTIIPGQPPNIWQIVVQGNSSGFSGMGATDIDVGLSVNILLPIPYPFAAPIAPNQPFIVAVEVHNPDGSPYLTSSIVAKFIKNGSNLFNVTLLPYKSFPGLYVGQYALLTPLPQGTYILDVDMGIGEAYTYEVFGEGLFGGIITPVISGAGSASIGGTILLEAEAFDQFGLGQFTSNITANIYNQQGSLVAQVPLQPAPNRVIFGLRNYYFRQIALFKIPQSFSPGFYTVVYQSSLQTPTGVEYGYFTTGFYVAPSGLSYNVTVQPFAYEGQKIKVTADIKFTSGEQAGKEVTQGIFVATVLQTTLNPFLIPVTFEVGVPLQYNSTLGKWIGDYEIPSELAGSIYQGLSLYALAGHWDVLMAGVASTGEDVISTYKYFDVLPYTYMGNLNITTGSLVNVPFLTGSGSGYYLSNIYANNLTVNGISLTLTNVIVNNLKAINASLQIYNSKIVSLVANNSVVTVGQSLLGGSTVAVTAINSKVSIYSSSIVNSTYAFNQAGNSNITLSGVNLQGISQISQVPPPTFSVQPSKITTSNATIIVNVTGQNIKILKVAINGQPVSYTVTPTSTGVTVSIPFNASSMPDGAYTLSVEVFNGLTYSYNYTIQNNYHLVSNVNKLNSMISNLSSYANDILIIAIISLIIGVIALILAFVLSRRARTATGQIKGGGQT